MTNATVPRVLVVEDSPTQAELLRSLLAGEGLEVLVAPHAERALELLAAGGIDLVISDIVMPGLSGYELCRRIKADPERHALPVILLSQLSEPMDIIRGLECGADNFLTKPYRPEQLQARVRTVLLNRQIRTGSAVIGIDIVFLGKRFTITSEKEQILDLLVSTFEDTVQANRELQRHRTELAAAKRKLEEYARALEGRVRFSEEKYALLLENANVAILICEIGGRILEVNRETATILGRETVDIVGHPIEEFVVPSAGSFTDHWVRLVGTGSGRLENATIARPDRQATHISLNASRVHLGTLDVVQVICNDITQRTLLEEQLRHTQRMEAMGQLTGGIAHDFNNLLGVVIGNLDVLAAKTADDSREFVENALEAALRGANLIKQLLAFARRQPLAPELIRIDERLPLTVRLLESTLRGNVDVRHRVDPDTRPVVADVVQLEAAILNLAVNARDAMPDGGIVTIECANAVLDEAYAEVNSEVVPGDYVMIAVSDNGSGMTPDIKARVFDPFFTTKGANGTGLGLSQVFGFVKQSGGHVKLYSEVGIGTTVRLYLPPADGDRSPDRSNGEGDRPLTGTETILLVEDDSAMRDIATIQLRGLGYEVIVTEGGEQALEILRSETIVDLLLTDIVMPGGIDGRRLALEARALRPHLAILFSSGFSEAAVAASIHRDFDTTILSKPYRKEELGRRLRAALAGSAS